MLKALLAACLFSLSMLALAGKPHPVSLTWLIEHADTIVIAKIIRFSADDTAGRCDVSRDETFYEGSIDEVLKGDITALKFCASQKLIASQAYLLFLDDVGMPSQSLEFLGGAPITSSFLDPTIDWIEIDSTTSIAPEPIKVRIEKIKSCPPDGEPGDCQIRHAREIIDLSLIRSAIAPSTF